MHVSFGPFFLLAWSSRAQFVWIIVLWNFMSIFVNFLNHGVACLLLLDFILDILSSRDFSVFFTKTMHATLCLKCIIILNAFRHHWNMHDKAVTGRKANDKQSLLIPFYFTCYEADHAAVRQSYILRLTPVSSIYIWYILIYIMYMYII